MSLDSELTESVVDDPELFLRVRVLRSNNPTDLRSASDSRRDKRAWLGFFSPTQSPTPASTNGQYPKAGGRSVHQQLRLMRGISCLLIPCELGELTNAHTDTSPPASWYNPPSTCHKDRQKCLPL